MQPPFRACSTASWSLIALLLATVAGRAHAAEPAYLIDAGRSTVRVHVGKAGLFGFAGHEHTVTAPQVEGRVIVVPENLGASRVSLSFATGALRVEEQGEPAGDASKVQEVMLGPRVLDVSRFSAVTFESQLVSGKLRSAGGYDLSIQGQLSLHGVTRSLSLPLRVEFDAHTLQASGRLVLRQSDYGITPVSVAGVVKVKDELAIDFTLIALPASESP